MLSDRSHPVAAPRRAMRCWEALVGELRKGGSRLGSRAGGFSLGKAGTKEDEEESAGLMEVIVKTCQDQGPCSGSRVKTYLDGT